MKEEQTMVSDQTVDSSGAADQKNTVQYETYKKTVGEVKSLKAKIAELEAADNDRKNRELSEQGKFKEALEAEQKKRKEIEASLDSKDKMFAKKIFSQEAEALALASGAKKEAISDLLTVGNWSGIEMDEDFSINKEQLMAAIETLKKEKPYFFVNQQSAPRDVSAGGFKNKETSKLTKDEIVQQLKSLK